MLLKDFPRLRLVVAGDGPLREELAAQARALAIADHVAFTGHCTDIQPILDAADVFALPSLWEALPFSLLEAMGAGVPVVATDVAGVAELVTTDQTGMLIQPKDAGALADALSHLLSRPDRGSGMAQAAKAKVEAGFSLKSMLVKTGDIYRGCGRARPQ
jgi:glycosyltransferase involved in cell wall biosynthesis